MNNSVLIGLSGGIGSGKSTVAHILSELGAEVIVGDELGKIVLETTPSILHSIRERYGDSLFDSDGTLLRGKLAEATFQQQENVRWLTELTFPHIHHLWREAVEKSSHRTIVFDAALIFEWGIQQEFDTLLAVIADPSIAVSRTLQTGRFSEQDILRRLHAQEDMQRKALAGSIRLTNNSTIDHLRKQVLEFWTQHIEPKLFERFNENAI